MCILIHMSTMSCRHVDRQWAVYRQWATEMWVEGKLLLYSDVPQFSNI